MTRQSRTDLVSAIAIMMVGAFFLMLAQQIRTPKYQSAAEAMVGPAMVPMAIAILIIALGALQVALALLSRGHRAGAAAPSDEEPSEFADFAPAMLLRLATVVAIGYGYIWLLSAVGYITSTAIVLTLMVLLFRNRPSLGLLLTILGGTAVYYYLFIRLMGLYLPTGWLISID